MENKNLWKKDGLLLIYFCLAGILFDYSKLLLDILWGTSAFISRERLICYGVVNILIILLAFILVLLINNRFVLYPVVAALLSSIGLVYTVWVTVGIVMIVWHIALGGFAGFVMFCNDYLHYVDNTLFRCRDTEIIKNTKEDIWRILKVVIQVILSFGAITGVCMTILFRNGYSGYDSKIIAVQMVIGFIFCAGATYIWALLPCLKMLFDIREIECS